MSEKQEAVATILEMQCKQIEKLTTNIEDLTEKLNRLIVDFEVFKKEMQLKSGIWGLVGGCIPVAIGFMIWLLQELIR